MPPITFIVKTTAIWAALKGAGRGVMYPATSLMVGSWIPRFLRHRLTESILSVCLIPVFYSGDVDVAREVVRACYESGAKVVEFTNRGAQAHTVFRELAEWCEWELPGCILARDSQQQSTTAGRS